MADGQAVFRAIADFASVIKASKEGSQALDGMSKSAQAIAGASEKAASRSSAAWSTAKGVIKSAVTAVAITTTAVATATAGLAISVFKTGAEYNILQQTSRAALKTILGGAEAANAQMDKLDEFARTSPFSKAVFIDAQQQLLSFGFAAEDVIPTLDAIQQAMSRAGKGNVEIAETASILAKIQSTGKMGAEDLNMLGERGVNAAKLIGDGFGKTEAEIRDAMSKGTLDGRKALQVLVEQMGTQYAGATALVKEQWVGAADAVKASWRNLGSILAAPFIDPNGGGLAVVWANKVADVLRSLSTKAKPAVDVLMGRLKPALDAVSKGLDAAKRGVDNLDVSRLNHGLDQLSKYAPLIAPVFAALVAFGGPAMLGPLGKFLPAINPVLAAIVGLIAASPELRSMLGSFLQSLAPLAPVAATLGRTLADTLLRSLQILAPALGAVLEAVAPLVVSLGSSFLGAVTSAVGVLIPLSEVVVTLTDAFLGLPMPLQTAIVAFAMFKGLGLLSLFSPLISVVSRLGESFQNAAVGTRIAAVRAGEFKLALSGISGVAGRAGSALLGAFGGPVGLAIAGVTVALGFLVGKHQEASQAAQAHRDYIAALADELGRNKGMIDGNTRAFVANALAQKEVGDSNILAQYAKSGGEVDVLTSAMLGNASAIDEVTAHLNGLHDGRKQLVEGSAWDQMWDKDLKAAQKNAEANGKMKDEILKLIPAYDEARYMRGLNAIATGEDTTALEGNTWAVRDNAAATQAAAGTNLSYKEAELAAAAATDHVTESVRRLGEVRADSNATAEEVRSAERAVEQSLMDQVKAFERVRDSMKKNNASAEEVNAKAIEQRDAFIQSAIGAGMAEDAANALADEYGLVPTDITTDFVANTDEAKASGDQLSAHLTAVGEDLKDWQISADGKSATKTGTTTKAGIDSLTGEIRIFSNPTMADRTADDFRWRTNNSSANVSIGGRTAPAESSLATLVRNIRNTVANMTIGANYATSSGGGGVNRRAADGLFVGEHKSFANGGMTGQRRQAMIAKGGSHITWAESETKGESYIPHAPSKRSRALAILAQTASMFGLPLGGPGLQMANGGVLGGRDAMMAHQSAMRAVNSLPAATANMNQPVAGGNMGTQIGQNIERVEIHNPTPERAGTSMARLARSNSYVGVSPQ